MPACVFRSQLLATVTPCCAWVLYAFVRILCQKCLYCNELELGSIPAASTIIGQAQLSVSKGSCAFLFCTDSFSLQSWYNFRILGTKKSANFLYNLG